MKKMSKTAKRVLAVILVIVVCIAVYKTCAIVKFEASVKAEYIFPQYDMTETEIHYNGRVYNYHSRGPDNYEVYTNYQDVKANRVYVKNDYAGFFYYFLTPLLFFNDGFDYFVYACPEEDPTGSFIIYDPHDSSINLTYIADDFVFPELNEDTVEGVYKFPIPSAKIGDTEITTEFIKAALSSEEIDIDNEIWEKMCDFYDKENLKCFYFRFKDCPLYSEEYVAEKTESGKYKIYERGPWYMYTQ